MKKILFISNISNRITNFAIPSIYAGQKLGYEVYLAANYDGFNDNADKYNVKLHHIDIVRNPISIKNVKAFKQMCRLIRDEKFDIIHCNTPIGGILGRICGKIENVPKIIYTAHGFHFYKGAPFINNIIYKSIERVLAHFTDCIITINNEDYEAAKKFKLRKNGQVYYVPGVGVNTKEYIYNDKKYIKLRQEIGINDEDILLISMGDLIKRKNYSTAIKAIAKVNDPKIHYAICGKGVEFDNLKSLVKELRIEKNVHFLGFRSDIKELLSISDIFLFTTYQEGLPRSMMEAMASGLPCIASDIRGNRDLMKDSNGGYLCESCDEKSFAKYIKKLANDKALRNKMGKNNMLAIKRFDIENIKEEIYRIYKIETKGS